MSRTGIGSALGMRWFAWIYGRVDRRQRPYTAAIRRALVGDLAGDVLDVGCGPGTNFEHYGPDARVVAVDYNEHMLAHARRQLAHLDGGPPPRAHIEVRQADAMALPFEDASFDAYVSTLVLCSVPDLDRAIEEAWRVLRPGGALRLFEHVRSPSPWKARLQHWLTPLWGVFADGCHLDRATHQAFLARGFVPEEEHHPTVRGEPLPLVVLRAHKPKAG